MRQKQQFAVREVQIVQLPAGDAQRVAPESTQRIIETDPSDQEILQRLEVENAALRDRAVELVLQIRTLRDGDAP
jgi:hypothetical protein